MKRFFIIKFTLILSYSLFGQETKLIERTSSDLKKSKETKTKDRNTIVLGPGRDFAEEYYVLKSDENIRHGTYIKYRQTFSGIQILESGTYQNGLQNGLWEYYHNIRTKNSSNSIKEKGVYVNGKKNGVWTSFYRDTIPEVIAQEKYGSKKKADSVTISIDQQSAKIKTVGMYLNDKKVGEWTSFTYSGDIFQKFNFSKKILTFDASIKDTLNYNANRKALFIGGLPNLIDFLTNEFYLPGGIMSGLKNDSTSVIVSFTIDKNGDTIEPKIENDHWNKDLEVEIFRVVALTSNKWIPAISESTPTDSVYKIQFYIIVKRVSATFKKFDIGFKPVFD